MRLDKVYSANMFGEEIRITIEPTDIVMARDADLWFWKVIDKAAKEMNVKPFCPCGERPHRVACPLGFDNYFRPIVEGKSLAPPTQEGQ